MKIRSKKYLLFLTACLLFSNLNYGQQPPASPGSIKGKVFDAESNSPLEFATISVFTSDSLLSKGGITANDGSFSIDVRPGDYYISVSFISYQEQFIDNISLSLRNREYDLGIIKLKPQTENLEEVAVIGEKSEMVISLDKKIFNVGKDLSNTGKSALDILDNIPSVTVDLDGNVSLRGSENLQILVDGKQSGLVSAGGTDALKNLQGNMIERIEVITNPSARYEAEGTAGIINIVLRKDQQKGVNGSFEITAGYPHQYSAGANVNFRREKINYFFNYSIRYNERPRGGYSWQQFDLADPDTSYITIRERESNRTGLSNRIRAGADFFISPTSTLTAAVLVANDDQQNKNEVSYRDYPNKPSLGLSLRDEPRDDQMAYRTNRADLEAEDQLDMELSLNYEKKFAKKDHVFTAQASYVKDAEEERSDITESVVYIALRDTISSPLERVKNTETETNFFIQADYIYPFGEKGKFEAGYRSGFRRINNPYYVEVENGAGSWDTIAEYSNNFEYIENIHALYSQVGNHFGKFSVQAGLRAELSDVRTYLHETDSANERLYPNLFPSVHASFQFNPVHSAQLSYSRRIQRPRFRLLNPFYSYTDPRNVRSGNPNLEPEYVNSFELGYLFNREKINFYSGVYYRYTTDPTQRVSEVIEVAGETVTVLTPQNLDFGQSYGFEANASLNLVKWWTLSGDFNFYRFMIEGTYKDQFLTSDNYSWNTRLNSKFKFPGNTDMQVIFFYRAPQESTQGMRETFYMMNAAISKDVLKGKGTLTLNVRDVLNSMKFKYILDSENLYSYNQYQWSSRQYTLTFVYRLNQKKRMSRNGNGGDGEGGMGGDDMGM